MYLCVECCRTTNTTNLIGDDEERVDEHQVMCLYREEAALLEREQNRSQQGDFGRAAHTHKGQRSNKARGVKYNSSDIVK